MPIHPLTHRVISLILSLFFAALLAACATAESPLAHTVHVTGPDGQNVSGALVTGRIGLRYTVTATTADDGTATLAYDPSHLELHTWTKITVEADGYPAQSVLVKLQPGSAPSEIRLGQTEPTPAAPTPAAAAPQPETPPEPAAEPARPLADIPPAERQDYFSAPPEMTVDPGKTYRATIKTAKGDIVVSLDAANAPQHVNNFIYLSQQGFYDGLTFHRVEPGFVIQGGDPLGSGQGGPGYQVPGEFDLKHIEGALAMARLGDAANPERKSSGSQFYITLAPTPFLDGQYSVFGKVEQGMDVAQSIAVGDVIEQIIVEEQ